MKKSLAFLLLISMVFVVLTGCGGGAKQEEETNSQGEVQGESEGKEIVIKLAHAMTPESAYHRAIDEELKQAIEKETNGRIKVELYPSAQLGGEREAFEAVGLGTIQMTIVNTANVANVDSNFSIFDFPFLFFSREAGRAAMDGEIGEELNKSLENYGYKNLGFGEVGMRFITNSKRPITKPEDLKGLKLRCMENPIHIMAFELLGANPTPMGINELFTALQQKTVDGQENPPAVIVDNKFHEVQDYMSLTGHFYHGLAFAANLEWFNSLDASDQELIAEFTNNAAMKQRDYIAADDDTGIEVMEAAGVEINDLTDEQKQVFVDAVAPVYEKYENIVAPGFIEKARALNK